MKTPEVFQGTDGLWRTRITLEGRRRQVFALPLCKTEQAAEKRALAMSSIARKMRTCGAVAKLVDILSMAAVAKEGKPWDAICSAVDTLCSGQVAAIHTTPTFREFGEQWTSGRLHKRYPDHVKEINHTDNIQRLREHVYPIIGDLQIDKITLTEADIVMQSIPDKLSPATRRHVAQVMRRVLELAVFPARLIPSNPLPKGYLPKLTSSKKASAYLYPSEDKQLLTCDKIPFSRRLLWGLLAREGLRAEEAGALRWLDLDLTQGIIHLDENKTDDPRSWALDESVARTLRAVRSMRDIEPQDALVFAYEAHTISTQNLARQLRRDLVKAGINRPALFESTKSRLRMRAHDLRATFITLALAAGKSETWVADRTGHTTSAMINRYRRQARSAAEVRLGWLLPLDELLAHDLPTVVVDSDSTGVTK